LASRRINYLPIAGVKIMATESIEIVGVHKVYTHDPCYLIEIIIHSSRKKIDMIDFTQEIPGVPESNWQVPYDDMFLNSEGTAVIGDVIIDGRNEELWIGDVRIAFFFHYLDETEHLRTPFGDVKLPEVTKKPKRLRCMKHSPID
jgi:hypothetical protein